MRLALQGQSTEFVIKHVSGCFVSGICSRSHCMNLISVLCTRREVHFSKKAALLLTTMSECYYYSTNEEILPSHIFKID